jgi:hypothetical protein
MFLNNFSIIRRHSGLTREYWTGSCFDSHIEDAYLVDANLGGVILDSLKSEWDNSWDYEVVNLSDIVSRRK